MPKLPSRVTASVRPQASRLSSLTRALAPYSTLRSVSAQISTLACAYYVFKIEKGFSGATQLKDEEEAVELSDKVAE